MSLDAIACLQLPNILSSSLIKFKEWLYQDLTCLFIKFFPSQNTPFAASDSKQYCAFPLRLNLEFLLFEKCKIFPFNLPSEISAFPVNYK